MQLLLFWMKLFLFQGGWPLVARSQSLSPPEVIIPLKIRDFDSGMKSSDWVSYSLKFEGKRHILHMKLIKHLLARHMPVFTYTDQGALLENYPFIPNNCYYYGYMDGDPKSQVSLSTCIGGFQGFLHIDNTVYQVEPKTNSTTFEHLVYKLVSEDKEFPTVRCGLADEEPPCQLKVTKVDHTPTPQIGHGGWWTHKQYYKLGLVANYGLYRNLDSNISAVQNSLKSFTMTMNVNMQQLDINVVLMGIEIWTDAEHLPQNSQDYLADFCKWKHISFSLRIDHDSVFFVFQGVTLRLHALGYLVQPCGSSKNKCGINYHDKSISTLYTATRLTTLLGLNLGMPLDHPQCTCGQTVCLMASNPVTAHRFSNCSYEEFYKYKERCLFNVPKAIREQRCGNGVPEEGEACDCGTLDSCAVDPCCETDCRLARGAQCAYGLCCKKCKFLPSGTVCRKQENECDLPEWCNGTHAQCPDDVFVQGGIPCRRGGVCYDKRCNTREEQCKRLFGDQAKSARMSCYTHVNSQGDRFGNCGLTSTSYTSCSSRNTLCGRLQCENVKMIPEEQEHHTWISTNISGTVCWGIDYHLGLKHSDIGKVQDGTECGQRKICVEGQCIPLSYSAIRCSPEKCSMQGICNNRHHCHCRPPWSPPHCYIAGVAGSVDSGPPPGSSFTESEDFSTEFDSEGAAHTHICSYLLILRFLVFLLIFLAILSKAVI